MLTRIVSRVNNEGPFLRVFGPETQPEGFISMIQKNLPEDRSVYRLPPEDEAPGVDQEELIAMIQSLGYKIYADFPLPLPEDHEMEKVEWADTSKWFGPDAQFQTQQDWTDVRGNCYLRHPDYFELPEHLEFDRLTPAQRWRIRSGLCRDAYRLPPKSEAQLFAEKLAERREAKEAKKKAEGSK